MGYVRTVGRRQVASAIDHELREQKTGAGRGMGAAGRWGEPGAVSDRESVLRNGQADPERAAGARSGDPLTFLCGRKRAGIAGRWI